MKPAPIKGTIFILVIISSLLVGGFFYATASTPSKSSCLKEIAITFCGLHNQDYLSESSSSFFCKARLEENGRTKSIITENYFNDWEKEKCK